MFTSNRDGDFEIYTIKVDGTDLQRLTRSPGNDAHTAWSPNGEWIAFASERGGFKDEALLTPFNPQPPDALSTGPLSSVEQARQAGVGRSRSDLRV